jgi:aminoglycoside phosphotransferase (APT) family kinase protein
VIISPVAHQVDREFRVLEALGKVDFPVPKVHCLCEDASVIGTSFYVCYDLLVRDQSVGELI